MCPYLFNEHRNNNENDQNSSGWCRHTTENNYPQLKGETRQPKYGSQSETTIDSCLWLGTIPGQTHSNTNIEQNIEYPPTSHSEQTKNRNIQSNLRSGRDKDTCCLMLMVQAHYKRPFLSCCSAVSTKQNKEGKHEKIIIRPEKTHSLPRIGDKRIDKDLKPRKERVRFWLEGTFFLDREMSLCWSVRVDEGER